jgi:hypothetical protein
VAAPKDPVTQIGLHLQHQHEVGASKLRRALWWQAAAS